MSAEQVDFLLRMEDHDIIPSCLSAERHKPRDFLLHYIGCEQFFQREDYLASLNSEQKQQVQSNLQRIQILRSALLGDMGDGRHLVQQLTQSLNRWRNTKEYLEGIERVRQLRTLHFALNRISQKDIGIPTRVGEYNPDVDTNAYLIRFKNGRPVHEIMDTRFHEQFPSYRISVNDLIHGREDDSPLMAPQDTVNYYHFPANNMLVSDMKNVPRDNPPKVEGINIEVFQWAEVRILLPES